MRRPEVLLVSKKVCPLCDEAKHALDAAKKQVDFSLETKLIDDDEQLHAAHSLEVPVVFIDDKKKFFGRVTALMLLRELRLAASS